MFKGLLVFLVGISLSGCRNETLFELIPATKSGIRFNNSITDNDTFNVLDVENIYNGGGVGIADFNNDGLQDIYFTGNMVPNKLYLNKGNFKFEDITEVAGVSGNGKWCRGISTIDINNDGLMDLYVSSTLLPDPIKRENLLYINKGLDEKGIPQFSNEAATYKLNDTSHTTMAAFFDYDNDGDLDVYLLVNEIIKDQFPNTFRPISKNGQHPSTDKLFRNDWSDSLKHPVFTNVSKEAGITIEGYGHGVTVTDINKDGWKDVYVTNDFLSNNILYINNKNGTFSDHVNTYFKHTSENSMGQDVIDINNDGLADVIEADMNPEDNYRKKMMMNPLSYQRYKNNDYYGYQYQYVRNVLQLNQGPRVQNDSIGPPVFSDISFFSGIAETDWSWTPSVADFDNDGFRDIIITNGFAKDVTDHDFIAFRNKAYSIAAKKEILDQIPQIKIANYAYKNNGDLTFSNVTQSWGIEAPSFSNGAAYADLDNDGDLDYVINNINGEASLYRNNERQWNEEDKHFLQVQLVGDDKNRNGIGAWVELHYDNGKQQVYENTPYRGYLSSIQNIAHFGLGNIAKVDSVMIKWPNGKMQLLLNAQADEVLKADIKDAGLSYSFSNDNVTTGTLFREVTSQADIHYTHHDSDFIDFNIQKLLPHKFSEYGPALSVGDIDGNGLDDMISGGSFFYPAQVFLQQQNGKFVQQNLIPGDPSVKNAEDMGLLLFDADSDKDLDLYISSGGYEASPNSISYQDRFYVNDGKGNFKKNDNALPKNLTSKSCVRAADFDKDGDLDLFVAGRVEPWHYPKPVSSFIFRNDSRNGIVTFKDVTNAVAKSLNNAGLICDATWTDFDNDGWQDLMFTGEWMPIRFLKNNKGNFQEVSQTGLDDKTGWWTSILPGDYDNDGDIDYIVGNLGKNSFYRADEGHPVRIYGKDFNNDGNYDAIPTVYLPTSQQDTSRKEFAAHLRDDMSKQIISFRSKFQNYRSYATSTFPQMFTNEELSGVLKLEANYFSNSLIRNLGNSKFQIIPLPSAVQFSCINGMVTDDFNGDGNLDVVINGNDYSSDVYVGRYDACNGLFLKGDGNGNFLPQSILQSGIFIPGNGKALVKLRAASGKCLLAASQNKDAMKIFELRNHLETIALEPSDVSVLIRHKSGKVQKQEVGYGASFLSQSARFINAGNTVESIEIKDYNGKVRNIRMQNP
ncbi:MAG: RNA-binding protein [Segetibacter sp.]|nr:RNA-binding protein [Segetibacter sp.]